jgi:acetolactate synthase-1/2/3 large subunit
MTDELDQVTPDAPSAVASTAEPALAPTPDEPDSGSATAEPAIDQPIEEPIDQPIEEPVAEQRMEEPPEEPADEPALAELAVAAAIGPRTVGRYVAEALRAAGVRVAYTVPGESFLGLLEHLQPAGIRVVATRHENGAAFAAEAHGQLTGRPAACLGTRAVGAANLAIGIQTAREDSTPMFVLVGGVDRRFRGRDALQEAEIATSIGGLASWAAEATDAAAVPALMQDAVEHALSGRPGPVVLVLPEDLLDAPVLTTTPAPGHARGQADRLDTTEVGAVLHVLTEAQRPLILAGAGVLRARCTNDLVRLAEMLRVPVMTSWRRPDAFPNDHPLYLGMSGSASPPSVRERLEGADAVLVLGSRLNELTTFGYAWPTPWTRWMHVDAEPIRPRSEMAEPTIAVTTDARTFVRASIARLGGAVLDKTSADARTERTEADRARWERETRVADDTWMGPGIHPGRTIATLRAVLPDDAILTTDAGNFAGWAARYFRFRRPGTFLGPTSGAMGYALPAAIAAALVHRDRVVVGLAGDGGFAMTMAELETAVRARTRVIILVFDNERYGTIRMHQDRRGDPDPVATDLGPIDFAAVAEGMGARGAHVQADSELEPALRAALASDRPTVIALRLDRGWVSVDERPDDEVAAAS